MSNGIDEESPSKEVTSMPVSHPTWISHLRSLLMKMICIFGTSISASAGDVPRFADFPINEYYRGRTVLPDFKGRDRQQKDYRTRITDGMESGPNFAGKFSIIQIGCGTECRFAFVGNNKTGEVLEFPIGGEDYLAMQLKFKIDSALVVASYVMKEACTVSYFSFDGHAFREIKKQGVQPVDKCYQEL